jgi:hypothetical protein
MNRRLCVMLALVRARKGGAEGSFSVTPGQIVGALAGQVESGGGLVPNTAAKWSDVEGDGPELDAFGPGYAVVYAAPRSGRYGRSLSAGPAPLQDHHRSCLDDVVAGEHGLVAW